VPQSSLHQISTPTDWANGKIPSTKHQFPNKFQIPDVLKAQPLYPMTETGVVFFHQDERTVWDLQPPLWHQVKRSAKQHVFWSL
jgi:hypothetical protein